MGVTAYGPAVDAGDADVVGRLWAEDAVDDLDIRVMKGRDSIIEMVRTVPHQDYVNEGCGDLLDPAQISSARTSWPGLGGMSNV